MNRRIRDAVCRAAYALSLAVILQLGLCLCHDASGAVTESSCASLQDHRLKPVPHGPRDERQHSGVAQALACGPAVSTPGAGTPTPVPSSAASTTSHAHLTASPGPNHLNDTSEGRSANEVSIRNYYFNYNNGDYRNNIVLAGKYRFSKALTFTGNFTLSAADKNGERSYGSGDSYLDAIYTLRRNDYFALGLGLGTIMPTASSADLGSGKVQLAPIVKPVFYPLRNDRLIAALQLRNFISVATVEKSNFISIEGDTLFFEPDSNQIDFLEIKPSLRYQLSERWEFYTEPVLMTVNWENHQDLSYRTSFRIIRMLTDKIGLWVQPEFPSAPIAPEFQPQVSMFFAF